MVTDGNENVATGQAAHQFAPNQGLVRAIAATKLSIFTPISDLGYYGWNPEGTYKSLSDVTKVDIMKSLDVDRTPAEIVWLQEILPKLPLPFAKIQAQEHINKYPYNPPHVVPLHVALRYRGVQGKDVKFLFHGSTLEMLATATIAEEGTSNYIAAVFPGTEIILVASHKEYVQNYSQIGFQFERLVTGKAFADRHDVTTAYHLQLMNVGGHAVLFSAEVDALDSMNDPVEVTCSNVFHWGSRVMFQMLSNGSLSLCHGLKKPGQLYNVQIEHFNKVASDALPGSSAVQLEGNIKAGMETLLKELKNGRFDDGGVFKVHFVASELRLTPFIDAEIFTNPSVIQGLIS